MDTIRDWGIKQLVNRKRNGDDAVMFDIDDTLITMSGKPIVPIIELAKQAIRLGYHIVIITARPGWDTNIEWTIKQLKSIGVEYTYLGFTSPETKTKMKQQLPYNFIMSVGDSLTDLTDSMYTINTSNFCCSLDNSRM